MPATSYPWLVADIGGTNARFGLVRGPGRVGEVVPMRCDEHPGPAEAARAYLAQLARAGGAEVAVRRAAFAVATPVSGDEVHFTNSPWSFSRRAVERVLQVESLQLLNDFEALALSLPGLAPDDYTLIGTAVPDPSLPMAVVGPGTGLGVGTLVPTGDGWLALPGEGGHVTLAPFDDLESDVLQAARAEFGHVSAERLLSGIGLPVLHRSVCRVRGEPAPALSAEEVTARGLAPDGADAASRMTIELFCALLGGFAGNVALTVGARGGVFVSGGIVPRLGEAFFRSRFRERFEAKGRFAAYLAPIATAVVTAPYPALAGAARAIEAAVRAPRR